MIIQQGKVMKQWYALYDLLCYMIWYEFMWYDMISIWYDVIYDMIYYDMMKEYDIWYDIL